MLPSATVTPNRDRYASTATLVAIINDTQTGNSPIQAAEYFIDKIGKNGTGTPMSAADGGFNSPKETVMAVIDMTGLSPGLHAIYVHGQDVQGNWGIVRLVYLRIYYPEHTHALVVMRYCAGLPMHVIASFILGFGINRKLLSSIKGEIPFLQGNARYFIIPMILHSLYNIAVVVLESRFGFWS